MDIAYGADAFQRLDVWGCGREVAGSRPVIMFIHGGAFRNGHKEWNGAMAPALTALPALSFVYMAQPDNFSLYQPLVAGSLWLAARGLRGRPRDFALAGLLAPGGRLGLAERCPRLGERLRIAGTAELSGYSTALDVVRCEALIRRAREIFPGAADYDRASFWAGLRPATPSNVPLVGRTRYANLFLNTGHGTLGWTLACGSGRSLADIISGRAPEVDFRFTHSTT